LARKYFHSGHNSLALVLPDAVAVVSVVNNNFYKVSPVPLAARFEPIKKRKTIRKKRKAASEKRTKKRQILH